MKSSLPSMTKAPLSSSGVSPISMCAWRALAGSIAGSKQAV